MTAQDVVTPEEDLGEFLESETEVPEQLGAFVSGATADPVRDYLKAIARFPLLEAGEEAALAQRIEVGLFAEHLLQTSPEWVRFNRKRAGEDKRRRHRDLLWIATDGRRAKDRLIESNLRFVVFLTKRYQSRGLTFLDLIQEGNVGLIHAVAKFDYSQGTKFTTYAVWWIRQSIERALTDKSRAIRLPASIVEIVTRLAAVQRELLQKLGRVPTPEELARELDLTPERVLEVQQYTQDPVSLDTPLGDDGDADFGDLIEDAESIDPVEVLAFELLQAQLKAVLETLGEDEHEVISLRFGLQDGRRQTVSAIARRLGISDERVKTIEAGALAKLRDPSLSQALYDLSH